MTVLTAMTNTVSLQGKYIHEDYLSAFRLHPATHGQPYAEGGYYGKTAFDDLHAVKKEYERKGIIFFTAAIDSDKEAIKRCYGERSFLDLSDLNKLPLAITKLIAKHI